MKRRSRLNLSAGVADDKEQAAGFDRVTAAHSDSVAEPESVETQGQNSVGTEQPRARKQVERGATPRATIIRTVAVIAAAALAFYLLKRRLF